MLKSIEKDQTIFYYRSIFEPVETAIVEDPTIRQDCIGAATDHPKYLALISRVHFENLVHEDLTIDKDHYFGASGAALLSNCFETPEEAWASKKVEIEKYKAELTAEITDLKSLLNFPLKHTLYGEDANYFAIEVYNEAVKNILKNYKEK